MSYISFSDFYSKIGFVSYPFSTYTAENEKDKSEDLFVQPSNYQPILDNFNTKLTMMLTGNRGTGKTAFLYDLLRQSDVNNDLICIIEDFSSIKPNPDLKDYYTLIVKGLTEAVFVRLVEDTWRINKLEKEDKLLLSYLRIKYINSITQKNLKEKIQQIQTSTFKRKLSWIYNFARYTLNYGATAASNFISDVITSHFFCLPPISKEGEIKEYFPELRLDTDSSFLTNEVSYNLLNDVCSLLNKLKFSRIIVAIDKIDEDQRFDNDAEMIADFIKPLLTDNKLLLNSNLQLAVCLWNVPFEYLKDSVRTQKHSCPKLSWNNDDLIAALNRRVSVYSDKKITDFKAMLSTEISGELLASVFDLSNSNPRDLWHIWDALFNAQYQVDKHSSVITNEAITYGLSNFVKNFNFYEYYPRKINARANTMDAYSYIRHLLKLESSTFTKNRLNEQAGTGSSTNNYVVGMEKIGLIKNLGTESGCVIYQINDPKVIYAMQKKIDIIKR